MPDNFSLQSDMRRPYPRETFWADLKAGTALVASYLPAAMALGVISGMGPLSGLWCGVFVGIIAALCGGTRALISGPSAVLAVIIATVLTDTGVSLAELSVIIVMAGAIQMALGLTGVGRFVSYMPHIVLTGLMSGIGVLLVATQVGEFFHFGIYDLALTGFCLALLFLWPARIGRFIPAPLAVVGVGWIAGLLIPGMQRLGPVPAGLPVPVIELPSLDFLPEAVGPAVLIALISSVYTLMWSLTADAFTGSRHDPNRELFGLGLGNIAAGIAGVLPGSGNIATISARRFGGRTVVAGIVCMVIIAALILGLGTYVAPMPLAALSAIVILVGWRLIEFPFLRKVLRMDLNYSSVMLLVMAVTIFVDPVFAIVFGVIAANIVNAARLETLELDSVISAPLLDSTFNPETDNEFSARIGLVAFRGSFSVSSSRKLINPLGMDIRDHEVVILDLSESTHIDDSAAYLLAQIIDHAGQTRTEIVVCGISDRIRGPLFAFGVLDRIPDEQTVATVQEARDLAWSLLDKTAV